MQITSHEINGKVPRFSIRGYGSVYEGFFSQAPASIVVPSEKRGEGVQYNSIWAIHYKSLT